MALKEIVMFWQMNVLEDASDLAFEPHPVVAAERMQYVIVHGKVCSNSNYGSAVETSG
jgi:hypothetical protein